MNKSSIAKIIIGFSGIRPEKHGLNATVEYISEKHGLNAATEYIIRNELSGKIYKQDIAGALGLLNKITQYLQGKPEVVSQMIDAVIGNEFNKATNIARKTGLQFMEINDPGDDDGGGGEFGGEGEGEGEGEGGGEGGGEFGGEGEGRTDNSPSFIDPIVMVVIALIGILILLALYFRKRRHKDQE